MEKRRDGEGKQNRKGTLVGGIECHCQETVFEQTNTHKQSRSI